MTHRKPSPNVNSKPGPAILFVVNDPRYFVTHRLILADRVKKAGYSVHVAGPRLGYEIATARIEQRAIPFHDVPIDRQGLNPLRDARAFLSLVRLYKTLRPDIVHHITVKPVLYGSVAARVVGIRYTVNAIAGLGRLFGTRTLLERVRTRVLCFVYRVALAGRGVSTIFQNTEDREEFLRAGIAEEDSTTLIVGSGTELSNFDPDAVPESPPIVAFVGRLLKQKGVREFLTAAKILKAQSVNARFVLVGDAAGNRDAVSEAELASAARSQIVELWGWSDDIPVIMRRSSVICLPSYHEGVPKALIDAAAAGRPVVATDIAGCRAVVEDGVSGLLVPARDSFALAKALGQLLENAPMRTQMGKSARTLAESRFDVSDTISAHLQLYQRIRQLPLQPSDH